jgi:hypothetical protein
MSPSKAAGVSFARATPRGRSSFRAGDFTAIARL